LYTNISMIIKAKRVLRTSTIKLIKQNDNKLSVVHKQY
jgi:hypothetical protein